MRFYRLCFLWMLLSSPFYAYSSDYSDLEFSESDLLEFEKEFSSQPNKKQKTVIP